MGLVLYTVLTVSARYTKFANLPFPVDRDAPEVQRILRRMKTTIKAVTMLLFAYIVWGQIRSAMGQAESMGIVFLPLFLVGAIAPLVLGLKQLRRYQMCSHTERVPCSISSPNHRPDCRHRVTVVTIW
jgi:hypothetical protein